MGGWLCCFGKLQEGYDGWLDGALVDVGVCFMQWDVILRAASIIEMGTCGQYTHFIPTKNKSSWQWDRNAGGILS
jgi:hypothetical protein